MNSSLATDIRNLIVGRIQSAGVDEVLAIASAISANEPRVAAAPVQPITDKRFTCLLGNGKLWLDPQDGEHVFTYDAKTDRTWLAAPLPGEYKHAAALKACGELDLLGHKDWRAPTIEELLSIVDYTRIKPAVDTEYFKGPYGWTWSSTLAKAPAGVAWYVYLSYGFSGRGDRTGGYLVRAVRSGQSLVLGF